MREPLQSGLALAHGHLTLGRILDTVRLPETHLVVLCACQSGLTDFRTVPDEAVGLPAGFLQAGARAVVATLWSVAALPTVILLRRFYDLLLAGEPPVTALTQATAWLRTLDRAGFDGEMATMRRTADPESAFHLEKEARKFPDEHPFASPAFWAAFTFNGSLTSTGGVYA
jgi:CHAT domain-containing protein